MSILVNVCGLLVASTHFPDTTLQQFYQQYYNCKVERSYEYASNEIQPIDEIPHVFPQPSTWWPVFTSDQLHSESFQRLIEHGVKPGLILPDEYFSIIDYFKMKKAVNQGAIPIVMYQIKYPKYFASKSIFSTAVGLRPLAALVPTGWDQNLIAQPAGTYIIQSDQATSLTLPARAIQYQQHYFYNATSNAPQSSGYQVIINPPVDMPIDTIEYPHLGISWQLNHGKYVSTPEGIETNWLGYFFIFMSTVVIPSDYVFSAPYPSFLSSIGSSISWLSLFLGGGLLFILIMSIIRRRRTNARN